MWKNAPRIQKWANYADLHHYILSDALYYSNNNNDNNNTNNNDTNDNDIDNDDDNVKKRFWPIL